tara:strand:- start:425 stop:1318 length:894 start_codon:yes stop_codon:yes gene_type:complete
MKTIIFITSLLVANSISAQEIGLQSEINNLNAIGEERRSAHWYDQAEAAKAEIRTALEASRRAPDGAHHEGYVTKYFYVESDMFAVYTKPLTVTDIVLEIGEVITGEVHIGDNARWQLAVGSTGTGQSEHQHIYVKPTQPRMLTNLIIPTNRRTYMIELSSTKTFYMPSVSWNYQTPIIGLQPPETEEAEEGLSVATVDPEKLYFGYSMSRKHSRRSWAPIRIFDDGQKTYVVFKDSMKNRDTPVLYHKTESGDLALVNFRVNMPYFIVDGLMNEIVLKLGHDTKDEIRIKRDNDIG